MGSDASVLWHDQYLSPRLRRTSICTSWAAAAAATATTAAAAAATATTAAAAAATACCCCCAAAAALRRLPRAGRQAPLIRHHAVEGAKGRGRGHVQW